MPPLDEAACRRFGLAGWLVVRLRSGGHAAAAPLATPPDAPWLVLECAAELAAASRLVRAGLTPADLCAHLCACVSGPLDAAGEIRQLRLDLQPGGEAW